MFPYKLLYLSETGVKNNGIGHIIGKTLSGEDDIKCVLVEYENMTYIHYCDHCFLYAKLNDEIEIKEFEVRNRITKRKYMKLKFLCEYEKQFEFILE